MKANLILAGATALATSLLALPVLAQSEVATGANVAGVTALNDRITDVQDDVRDDFDRSQDAYRFGTPDQREGLSGGMSLSYSGRTGNAEDQDFVLAGRLSHRMGQFGQNVGIALEFSENDDGSKDTEETFAVYDANYSFNDRLYAFVLGRVKTDALADDFDGLTAQQLADRSGRLKRDAFLGFGPGYRILNSEDTAWRVQAGVGIRYTQKVDYSERDNLASNTETGYIASSRFYHRFNDTLFLTNDTDWLKSDSSETVNNELGLNVKMSDQFATRVSYITEYEAERPIRTDNKLGVSLVYGF